MRIAILHPDVASSMEAGTGARRASGAVEALQLALRDLGHAPVRVPIVPALDVWAARLVEAGVDRVFNLCGHAAGASDADAARVAAAVELLGLPLAGASSETLALTRREERVRAVLAAAGLPVPAGPAYAPGGELGGRRGSPAPAPDLPAGRALVVGIVAGAALPVAGVERRAGTGRGRLVCPAPLAGPVRREAVRLALAAWGAIGGRGYGRVDLHAGRAGRLQLLGVDPAPDLSPSAALARMAAADGWGYIDLIGRILREPPR